MAWACMVAYGTGVFSNRLNAVVHSSILSAHILSWVLLITVSTYLFGRQRVVKRSEIGKWTLSLFFKK